MLEFYAGNGALTRYCKLSGLRAGALDIMYQLQTGRSYGSNPMDILSASGFALLGLHSESVFFHALYIHIYICMCCMFLMVANSILDWQYAIKFSFLT